MRLLPLLALLLPPTLAACDGSDSCTMMSCSQSVRVTFAESRAASYAVDVVVDGVSTTCATKVPRAMEDAGASCSSPGFYLRWEGAALGGLEIPTTDARSITVRVTRDGATVREATFAPSYQVSPGPNGPECAPRTCSSAVYTLP